MKSLLAAVAALTAVLTFSAPTTSAMAAMPAAVTADGIARENGLIDQVRWRGGGRGYHRGFHRRAHFRPWRPVYRPYYYRPRPVYFAPPLYGPRTVCRVRNRQVWNGWAYVWRPVRVCWRRW